jgi:UDP-N-acetylglucosamine 2-epimerase
MLDQVLQVFQIAPDHDLNIMQQGQTLSQITVRALSGLDEFMTREKAEFVVAQGDTTTTFIAALAAFYHRARFGHVEAGLRTGNRWDPFPEEMNRLLTTRLATLHFAPTQAAAENLAREGVDPVTVHVTGNTGIDAMLAVSDSEFVPTDAVIAKLMAWTGPVILVTAHRRENWGERMERICRAIKTIVEARPDSCVVFALHRNPTVRDSVFPILGAADRVFLIEPPDYLPFVKLQRKATIILTDSGGVQEEAPSLGKPVLVLRETTERPEGIEAGVAKLVGTDTEAIVRESLKLLTDRAAYDAMARAVSPYGDGQASKRIVDLIERCQSG